jgi:RND superfamily putative drug exporter
MFEGWGRVIYRRRWLTLVIAAAGIVIAAAWGTGVFGALTSGNSFTAGAPPT